MPALGILAAAVVSAWIVSVFLTPVVEFGFHLLDKIVRRNKNK